MEVVAFAGVVHLGPVGDPQSHAHVVHANADKGQVEIAAASEASPPQPIENSSGLFEHAGVANHDGLQQIDLYEIDDEE